MTTPASAARLRPLAAFGVAIVATLALWVLPFGSLVGRPLLWLSTLAHEGGHGLAAVLVGGTCERLQLFVDGSGVATSRYDFGQRAWVALGGLVGPAVAAALVFVVGTSARLSRAALAVVGVLTAIATFRVIDGAFAVTFTAVVALSALLAAWRCTAEQARVLLLFLGVQLALSVFSRADYLFTATARTGAGDMPSDVAVVAGHWGGPLIFWGAAIGAASALALLIGMASLVLADRAHRAVDAWRARRARP